MRAIALKKEPEPRAIRDVGETRSDRQAPKHRGCNAGNRVVPDGGRVVERGYRAPASGTAAADTPCAVAFEGFERCCRLRQKRCWRFADGIQVKSASPGLVMSGRRLSMIEKRATGHKGSALTRRSKSSCHKPASVASYGELHGLSGFSCRTADDGQGLDGGEVKSI
jgi:hypothetical protein